MSTQDLDILDADCSNALSHCKRILADAGVEMTAGGEVECYSMLPEGSKLPSPREVKEQYISLIRFHPDLLTEYAIVPTGVEIREHEEDAKRHKGDPIRWAEELATRYIEDVQHPVLGLNELLKLRVAHRLLKEGIPLKKAHEEKGVFHTPVTVVDYDGNCYNATGQQLEVSIGEEDPETLAVHLKRTRTIIQEESKALGLVADFRSLPPYASIPSALHIHFGLRFMENKANAFLMDDGVSANALSDSCDQSATTLLNSGGVLLACPSQNDYERLRLMGMRLSAGEHRTNALHERERESKNYHKELRIPGGNTPPSAAVLLAALSVTDSVLSVLGHTPEPLENITLSGDPHTILNRYASQPYPEREVPYQKAADIDFKAAKKQLTSASPLGQYTPDVYAGLCQLHGHAIYR